LVGPNIVLGQPGRFGNTFGAGLRLFGDGDPFQNPPLDRPGKRHQRRCEIGRDFQGLNRIQRVPGTILLRRLDLG
jgi:hypothetical protein